MIPRNGHFFLFYCFPLNLKELAAQCQPLDKSLHLTVPYFIHFYVSLILAISLWVFPTTNDVNIQNVPLFNTKVAPSQKIANQRLSRIQCTFISTPFIVEIFINLCNFSPQKKNGHCPNLWAVFKIIQTEKKSI